MLLGMSLPTGTAQSHDDAPMIGLDAVQGMFFENELNLSGWISDESTLSGATWHLYDGSQTVANGSLTLVEAASEAGGAMVRNDWQLDLNSSTFTACTCVFEVMAEDESGQISIDWLILFKLDPMDDELNLPPQVLIDGPSWAEMLHGTATISGMALDDSLLPPEVQWAFTHDPAIMLSCVQPWIGSARESLEWTNGTDEDALPGRFAIDIDTTGVDDGEHALLVRAVDGDGLASAVACVPIGINNAPPVVDLAGPEAVTESLTPVTFDGSGSTDPAFGRSSLIFVWMIEHVDSGSREMASGLDLRTYTFEPEKSGTWEVTLTVADAGGLTDSATHAFNVTNVAPTAALRIDGQPVQDGDILSLADAMRWELDASESMDSDNDRGSLVYTWYLDGEPIMLGQTRHIDRDMPGFTDAPHTLALSVEDDDGASDWITIRVGVIDTDSDPRMQSSGSSLPVVLQMGLLVLVFCSIIAAGVLITRRHQPATGIPKWKNRRAKRQTIFDEEPSLDQTDAVEDEVDDLADAGWE